MKKMLTSGLVMAALFATANAFADDPNANKLTTKGYVDAGLNYVHNEIGAVKTIVGTDANSGLRGDVAGLQSAIGTAGTGGATGTGLIGRIETLENSSTPAAISALEQAVGDANSGLIKDVADLQSDVSDLQTAVGDANSGLTKDVADNADDIADLQTTVGDANSGLVKDVADLQGVAKEYIGGTGITVTDGTGADAGKKVISLTNGIADTWDPSVLTNP